MKKVLLILMCCMAIQSVHAQDTPKWADKAKKAVFSIVTYDKENKIKNTGNGFYIDNNGTALSDYSLFEDAERAVIINADGKELPVTRIAGANSMYDVIKFRTETEKKITALKVATQPAAVGETVYLLPYSTQKAATCQTGKVTQVDTIADKAYYYTLTMTTSDKTVSCPIMNANGEVLGLIQKSASEEDKESYAIGASYGESLSISPLSANDINLNKIGIAKALPETEDQALVYLYMSSSQMDAKNYLATLNDFLQAYPNSTEGYTRRAGYYMNIGDDEHNALAEADLKKAMDVSGNKTEGQYNVAKIIYSYCINLEEGKKAYGDWSYDKALNIIREAIATDAQPVYIQLEGDILFAMRNYTDAYKSYEQVNQTPLASAATFYSAAKTKQLIEGTEMNEVIALMDSAIARFTPPYTSEATPYFYERAEMKAQTGKYREAVVDYDEFYDAIGGRVTAAFYLQREQAEIQCKMYQQAINDINKAVEMSPENVEMWIEKGSVHLRVGQFNEAVEALKKAISLDPKAAAAYRMLGYCQVQQKNNKEACTNFAKAKELGDTVVDSLIQKYCK